MSLDIGLLISGAKERGELENRITTLIKEIKKLGEKICWHYIYHDKSLQEGLSTCWVKLAGNIILFIDEVHTIVGSGTVGRGNKGTGLDIANLFKPSLGRAELQVMISRIIMFRCHWCISQFFNANANQ